MFEEMLKEYSRSEIIQICKYLNRDYNIYDPNELGWKKVKYAFDKTPESIWSQLQKQVSFNEFVNYIIMNYYVCERVVKYYFIEYLKNALHDIVAFEMSVGDSRIDICRINGKLCAYEIKTEYDNYDRLSSQMADYIKAFEKVYVVVPIQKVNNIKTHIPQECGIIAYRIDKHEKMIFSYHKKARENVCDINFCINSLSSSDLIKLIKILGFKPASTKEANIRLICGIIKEKNIVHTYKRFLKSKYCEQWDYLKNNFESILPIDCQCFFSSKMSPAVLYENRNGHMAF